MSKLNMSRPSSFSSSATMAVPGAALRAVCRAAAIVTLAGPARPIDLPAQPADKDVDRVADRFVLPVVEVSPDHGTGHDFAGVMGEEFEQGVFLRRQGDIFPASLDPAGEGVDLQVGDDQAWRARSSSTIRRRMASVPDHYAINEDEPEMNEMGPPDQKDPLGLNGLRMPGCLWFTFGHHPRRRQEARPRISLITVVLPLFHSGGFVPCRWRTKKSNIFRSP
jgi:hypothetical protein